MAETSDLIPHVTADMGANYNHFVTFLIQYEPGGLHNSPAKLSNLHSSNLKSPSSNSYSCTGCRASMKTVKLTKKSWLLHSDRWDSELILAEGSEGEVLKSLTWLSGWHSYGSLLIHHKIIRSFQNLHFPYGSLTSVVLIGHFGSVQSQVEQ